jgi:hypothetical protein
MIPGNVPHNRAVGGESALNFDFWQQWGRALSDRDFARAWLALGIVAGSRVKQPAAEGYVGLLERDPTAAAAGIFVEIAKSALGDALSDARSQGGRVGWTFPTEATAVDADGRLLVTRVPPQAWASAWQQVAQLIGVPPRVRVADPREPHRMAPWYRLLLEADPEPGAVSLVLAAPRAQLAIEWPLRVAALPDNGANRILSGVLLIWPSSRLARGVPIDRSNANCDVLFHEGTTQSLRATLRDLPFRCKANIVALLGPIEPDEGLAERLQAIADMTCASGIVLQTQHQDAQKTCLAWNRFVEEVSHNVTMDRALHVGARDDVPGDVAIWLTDTLADRKLSDLTERIVARVRQLPPGSTIDISGLRAGWVRSAPPPGSAPGLESAPMPADSASVEFDPGRLSFEAESAGASELAILSDAIENASEPAGAEVPRAARYLQQRSFVERDGDYVEARNGFVVGQKARVSVQIGPPDQAWQSLAAAFPEHELPPAAQWRLTLWLSEPSQLPEPLRGTLILPRSGPTTRPCEFHFTPKKRGRFEGRISVLHRGRVLQTAILRARVVAEDAKPDEKAAPQLAEVIPVRHRLGDLDRRRQFDLAFVTNHTVTGEPRGVALSADKAWIANVTNSLVVAKQINEALSKVSRSVLDYADGIEGDAGRELIVDLARQGERLRTFLVSEQLRRPGNRPDIAEKEYIQIVSTESDATVPFEFIYDYDVPSKAATPCPHWREALTEGHCRADCTRDSNFVCPMGFWGVRKVIERHQVSAEHAIAGRQFFLQSEPGRNSDELSLGGTALVARSSRVTDDDLKSVVEVLLTRLGKPPKTPATWTEWAAAVGGAEPPRLLLAMPHADGTPADMTLEIGGDTISTIDVKPAHLRKEGEAAPLVALLGCDIAGTANDYTEHIVVFRERGAAIVVATIATVFGGHAASVARLLAEELIPNGAPPQRLGEAIRALKRRALLDGLVMAMCVVAYGDADWRLVK